jgi:Flp pilus assembly protein TadB
MVSSRKRYLWFVAAFPGMALVVLALLFVRNRAAEQRAASEARRRAVLAEVEVEHRRLLAELEKVRERARSKLEETNERRDGGWLCERVRCNEADRVPIWDTEPAKLTRDPYDDWAREPRRRR